MQFWHGHIRNCISLLSGSQKILSSPLRTFRAKHDKKENGLEGLRKNKGKCQDFFFALHTDSCHRAAWSSETDSSAKTAAPAAASVDGCMLLHDCSLFIFLFHFTSAAWGSLHWRLISSCTFHCRQLFSPKCYPAWTREQLSSCGSLSVFLQSGPLRLEPGPREELSRQVQFCYT